MKLAQYNYNHFGNDAVKSYITGHTLALEYASKATSLEDLKYAYFIEGYADHFLTDLFATGHSRTPRVEIVNYRANLAQNTSSYPPIYKVVNATDGSILINEYDAKTKSYHQLKCLSSTAAAWNYVFN